MKEKREESPMPNDDGFSDPIDPIYLQGDCIHIHRILFFAKSLRVGKTAEM